jgi:chitinase
MTTYHKSANLLWKTWNFGIWDYWARSVSRSKTTKVYLGAPASSSAAGGGYVDINTLSRIATQMRKSFPSFGGVMLWDASQAYGASNVLRNR